jgi:CBS domain-containing protein
MAGDSMKRNVDDLLKEKGYVVYTISDNARLKDAVKLFNKKRIGALMVVNENEEIKGIITERDILRKLGKTEGEIKDMSIQLVMTPREKLIVATPEDSVEYLMKVMTANQIRHVPIVGGESNTRLMGLVSIGDVVKILLSGVNYENKLLKDYLEKSMPV